MRHLRKGGWRWITLLLLLGAGLGGGIMVYRWQKSPLPPRGGEEGREQKPVPVVEKGEEREVILFFATPAGDRLAGEPRLIPRGSLTAEIRAALQALIPVLNREIDASSLRGPGCEESIWIPRGPRTSISPRPCRRTIREGAGGSC